MSPDLHALAPARLTPDLGRVDEFDTGPGNDPETVAARSTDHFRELFHQAPCGYLITDDDGSIRAVNDTFVRWTGWSEADLLGTHLARLLPAGDRILYSTHCEPRLTMLGAVAEVAVDVIGADGVPRAALLSAARSPATPTTPATIRVIIASAHERRRYERELLAARRAAEHSEARRAEAEAGLRHLALHDSLTGLANRAALAVELQAMLDSSQAAEHVVLLFIDLDHFKEINDSLGHAAGDELIVTVADRLRSAVRSTALLARLAGDEFVLVDRLPSREGLDALADRVLTTIRTPVVIDGIEITPTASIGAVRSEGDQDTADQLLRHADIAMYQAKAAGRNVWRLHDRSQDDPARDRLRQIGELRRGIAAGEMVVHYQPRVELRTGRVHSAEALVRWQHPTRGLLSPSEFIEVAETSGLITALGAYVLERAVAEAVTWQGCDVGRRIGIAVNLSPRQLNDPGLVTVVTDILNRHGLPPDLLTLEITETALMTDPDAAVLALHALGITIAIDDFGTGYSSLTYLKRFPIRELKIDQSFVAGLGTDSGDEAIVVSCIRLAHAVGMHAVAEGVENDRQRQILLELGCDLAQGYLFARPLAAGQVVPWRAAIEAMLPDG
jgi:diguanylate cyclase (GGDEF)-like protein/PAS domain S-box-containing protein